ncbi:unnamed protein product [Amoebophrya sp. A120]|nr:unnamed protein product [Amoebophrya sp. A120]|eukprot:GSA120T00003810001.1
MVRILETIGWQEVKTEVGKYYWCEKEERCQSKPPLYEVLGLLSAPSSDGAHTRHQIFKAYQEKLAEFGEDTGSKDLLLEAYTTLTDVEARAVYDCSTTSEAARNAAAGLTARHLSTIKCEPIYVPPEETPAPEEGG